MRRDETQNPYQDLNAIHNINMFFGRVAALRRLYSAIANHQCLSLVGPRRIGKSALLAHISLTEEPQPFGYDLHSCVFVFLDMRDYRHGSSTFFFKSVSERIATACQRRLPLAVNSKKGSEQFKFLLKRMRDAGLYPVLLMDAFDNIIHNEHFDTDFFSFLRAQAQNYQVSYVTASIAPLNDICRQELKDSPFFNIFTFEELGPLTAEEARTLITLPAQRADCPFTAEEQEWLLALAGRHPLFLQRVCHFLFEEKCLNETTDVDFCQVEKRAYAELKPHFATFWQDLKQEEQQAIKNVIYQGVVEQQSRAELSESQLFRHFVRENRDFHITQVTTHLTLEAFEDLLDSLGDVTKLGRSHLRHLRIVTTRLTGYTEHSPSEVGRVVKEILKEAHERLRDSDTSHENETGWQFYNLLDLRYFKRSHYKLNSAQLASRLNYSERSYFRERSKAVQTLLEIVMEMEKALP